MIHSFKERADSGMRIPIYFCKGYNVLYCQRHFLKWLTSSEYMFCSVSAIGYRTRLIATLKMIIRPNKCVPAICMHIHGKSNFFPSNLFLCQIAFQCRFESEMQVVTNHIVNTLFPMSSLVLSLITVNLVVNSSTNGNISDSFILPEPITILNTSIK